MIIRPVYNILLLPDVAYYFKKDFFSDSDATELKEGNEILFAILKNETSDGEYTAEDFEPIGVSARIEGNGEGENVQVRTVERVDISDL